MSCVPTRSAQQSKTSEEGIAPARAFINTEDAKNVVRTNPDKQDESPHIFICNGSLRYSMYKRKVSPTADCLFCDLSEEHILR